MLDGPLVVRILTEGAGPDRYEIDLTHTAISLPWIGWSKAARTATPASIAFAMSEKGGVTTLGDLAFRMEGGRKADGTVSFGDSGLVRADLADISLNPGDRFNVNVSRKGRGYQIEASGQSFDSRPVLQMILHGEGLSSSGGGGTDVSLSANFGRLSGFNDQVMENAVLRYESGGGHLNLLDARGAINGQLSRVQATRQGDTTSFSFTSDDAGAMIAIAGFYDKMSGGKLSARLNRTGEGPFIGKVAIKDFTVVGEERLAALTAAPAPERFLRASGRLKELDLRKVRFDDLKSDIVKSENRLELQSGWLRNGQIGLTFDGIAFDESDQMNLKGTFMAFFIISRVIGEIPIIGDILSNGKNSGLIGITYRLRGAANNPGIAVNPLSVVAPGIFREIFEFKN